jgi:hypothetical protein
MLANELEVVPKLANRFVEEFSGFANKFCVISLGEFIKELKLVVCDWGAFNSPPAGVENRLIWLSVDLANILFRFTSLPKMLLGLSPDMNVSFSLLSDYSFALF